VGKRSSPSPVRLHEKERQALAHAVRLVKKRATYSENVKFAYFESNALGVNAEIFSKLYNLHSTLYN